ncbi:MAG TPA: phosphodiester glycosidase family protein [Parvularculaceae bacterium]|nr:phosphodiester glycosidase family protein [Parvularculaceae bacterium]
MRKRMRRVAAGLAATMALWSAAEAACREDAQGDARYVICDFDPARHDIRLFLNDEAGEPYGDFGPVSAALEAQGEKLLFAMNAGMYHEDRSPVGLYIENGEERKKISTKDGPGNFHLKPNGVFWMDDAGGAHVTKTEDFIAQFPSPACGRGVRGEGEEAETTRSTCGAKNDSPSPPTPLPQAGEGSRVIFATQSGPMLVIAGAIHPRFLVDATSGKRRNGVGVTEDGTVIFALSDTAVTFHEFATYFRDALDCPNALYLDGTISRLYAPELDRNDPGVAMGPIVGIVGEAER